MGLNLREPLYVGGVDVEKVRIAPGVEVDTGFQGCVSEVQYFLSIKLKLILLELLISPLSKETRKRKYQVEKPLLCNTAANTTLLASLCR